MFTLTDYRMIISKVVIKFNCVADMQGTHQVLHLT